MAGHNPKMGRYRIEYAFFRPAIALFDLLPLSVVAPLAQLGGNLAFAADNRRRDVACNNIRQAGIAQNENEVRRIAKASFRHFAGIVANTLKSDDLFKSDAWQDKITLNIPDDTRAALEDQTKGFILASGHVGNWEIGARCTSMLKPVVGIARRMNNPFVEKFMQRRTTDRFKVTPKHDADMKRLLAALSDGNTLAILIDQHASADRGVMVDFFGRPAATYASTALLHLTTKTPMAFGYCAKNKHDDGYTAHYSPLIRYERTGSREHDVKNILTQLNTQLEAAIRQHPEQYLWAHRRWRS